jgi:hypothetical protein
MDGQQKKGESRGRLLPQAAARQNMRNSFDARLSPRLLLMVVVLMTGLLMSTQPGLTQGKSSKILGPPAPPPAGRPSTGVMPGQPEIRPLVTDLEPTALPEVFGEATTFRMNADGDFVFISGRSSGLFLRETGGSLVRISQRLDPAPGIPDSQIDLLSAVQINASGLVLFDADFMLAEGATAQHGIWTYDGTGYRLIAHTRAVAPGTDDAQYGRTMGCCGFNDNGAVAFSASLTPVVSSTAMPARTTVFVAPAGGEPVRIAGPGDPAPGMDGATFGAIQMAGRLSDGGEVFFTAAIVGGSGGYGLFAGSVGQGVRKIVADGDPKPGGGAFVLTSPPATVMTNAAGDVAFAFGGAAGSIWTHSVSGGIAPVVIGQVTTIPLPSPLTGPITGPVLRAFNDAGETAFSGYASRPPPAWPTPAILMRSEPGPSGNALHLVAAQDSNLDGSTLRFGYEFRAWSLNNDGVLTFSNRNGWPSSRRLYRHFRGSEPFVVTPTVGDGDPVPLDGGGVFSLSNTTGTQTLPDGSILFSSDVLGNAAFSGVFRYKLGVAEAPGVTEALMSTADPLPAGARESWRPFRVGAAGNFVTSSAELAGGQASIWRYDTAANAAVRVVGDGDPSPDAGVRLRVGSLTMPPVNRSGGVAFLARQIGGAGGNGVYFRDPAGQVRKIVAQGDALPSGGVFNSIGLDTVPPRDLNDSGQVVFTASLAIPNQPNWVSGVFRGAAGETPQPVAVAGDTAGGGRTFASFSSDPGINASGMVAFQATVQDTAGQQIQGLFIRMPDGTLVKVVQGGDPWTSGSTFPPTLPTVFAFNDRGELGFMTPLDGGPGGGVFVGSASGLTAVALNGQSAPSGGRYAIDTRTPELDLSADGDVAFRATLTGGSAESGAFLWRRSDGLTRTILLEGQNAPGTLGTFTSFSRSANGWPQENLTIGANGDVAVSTIFQVGGDANLGFWRFRADNTLERLFMRGSLAPQSGGAIITSCAQGATTDDAGRFYYSLSVTGGRFTNAIYVTK